MRAVYRNFAHPRGFLGWIVGHLMAWKNRERSEWALGLLAPRAGERVLEVGFGSGTDVAALAAAVGPTGHVAGVDPSREMQRHAAARNRAAIAAGRAALAPGTAEALPHPPASFDAVYSVNTAFFWPDLDAGCREIARVLRPEGRVLIALQPLWRGAGPKDAAEWGERVASALKHAGLAKAETTTAALASGTAVAVLAAK
jgi:SAM-dependent methyltransferase